MSRRKVLAVLVIVLVIITVLFGVRQYFVFQEYQRYIRSADPVAEGFINALASDNYKTAKGYYSQDLLANYSDEYWNTQFFPRFKNYKGTPKLHTKGPAQTTDTSTPSGYDPQLKQDPTRYEYDFAMHNLTYRVTFVIFKQKGEWKINELDGAYLP